MGVAYTLYDSVTGQVVQTGEGDSQECAELQSRPGTARLVGRAVNGEKIYIDVATLADITRPEIVVDRTSAPRNAPFTFDTPVGTKVYRDPTLTGTSFTLVTTTTAAPYEFRFGTRGTFLIRVEPPAFPYQPQEFTITVT
jgi:hypothetical protein